MPKAPLIKTVVFISGLEVMVLELVGSRVLAPHVGTSIFTWTSLIAIILGSLSLGYFLGGKIADKDPTLAKLSKILFLAGLLIGLTALINKPFLMLITSLFKDIRTSSMLSAIVLFAPASIFLGMVTPITMKLQILTDKSVGSTVGNLNAISALGSITGTFLAGFFLISFFGSQQILVFLTITTLALSLAVRFDKKVLILLALTVVATCSALFLKLNLFSAKGIVFEGDTQYSHVQVWDSRNFLETGKAARVLQINKELHSAIFTGESGLVFPYTELYFVATDFNRKFKNTLMIGGGAYTFPSAFLQKYPEAKIDVVEIDPDLINIGRKYFRIGDNPRMKVISQDGRTYLNQNRRKYDIIFGDAFASYFSIPYELTTREAAQKLKDSLSEDGVVAINIISSVEGSRGKFLRAEYKTFKSVFPQVYLFTTDSGGGERIQNIILVALLKSKAELNFQAILSDSQFSNNFWAEEVDNDVEILTDDFAPTERYLGEMLLQI